MGIIFKTSPEKESYEIRRLERLIQTLKTPLAKFFEEMVEEHECDNLALALDHPDFPPLFDDYHELKSEQELLKKFDINIHTLHWWIHQRYIPRPFIQIDIYKFWKAETIDALQSPSSWPKLKILE